MFGRDSGAESDAEPLAAHLSAGMAGVKRLAKEIKALQAKPPDGVSLHTADDARCWLVDLQGAPDTLYAGEQYQLQFVFGEDYPMGAPEVTFVGTVPVHHHIYSNGHICLSLLVSPPRPCSSLSASILRCALGVLAGGRLEPCTDRI